MMSTAHTIAICLLIACCIFLLCIVMDTDGRYWESLMLMPPASGAVMSHSKLLAPILQPKQTPHGCESGGKGARPSSVPNEQGSLR